MVSTNLYAGCTNKNTQSIKPKQKKINFTSFYQSPDLYREFLAKIVYQPTLSTSGGQKIFFWVYKFCESVGNNQLMRSLNN